MFRWFCMAVRHAGGDRAGVHPQRHCQDNVNTEISYYTVEKVKALLESGKNYHLSQVALKEVGLIKEVVNKYATMFRSA